MALTQEKNIELSVEKNGSAELNECPVATAIDVIGGKWKVIILYQLRGKTLRFGELRKILPKITQIYFGQTKGRGNP